MIYVALLRGINVGGNNKVDMKLLKKSFLSVGMTDVVTYINSGNIIFSNSKFSKDTLILELQKVILRDFNLNIKVLIRTFDEFENLMKHLPKNYKNDSEMKSDVLFIDSSIDDKSILSKFNIKDRIDTVLYFQGVIFWTVDKVNLNRSGLKEIVKDKNLYNNITIRNVNTTRKIFELMCQLKK